MNQGDASVSRNQWKDALEAYAAAAHLAPHIVELPYWHAVALVNGGRVQEALPIFKEVFRREPRWRDAARRLAKVKQLPSDEALLKLIEAQ
jgi:predicted Zn-dependent protease